MKSRSTLGVLARLLAVLLALSLVAAACGDDGDDGGTDTEGDSDDATGADDDGPGEAIDETGNEIVGEGDVQTEDEEAVRGGTLRIGVEAETDSNRARARFFLPIADADTDAVADRRCGDRV